MEHHVNVNDTIVVHYGNTNKPQTFKIKRMSVEPWICIQEKTDD